MTAEVSLSYIELAVLFFANTLMSIVVARAFVASLKNAHSKEMKKLQASVNVLTSGSLGMGQRMISLEQKLQSLRSSQEEMQQSNLDMQYSRAQKLIEQGMDSLTVSANSGLSSSEVQLMQLLYQTQKASKTADHSSVG